MSPGSLTSSCARSANLMASIRSVSVPQMMNENAMPNSASASIRPIPMNIVVRTWFAYSGCRAIASTDFPISTPSPMPGPIAASPITRPLPMAVRPVSVICATRWTIDASYLSLACSVRLSEGPTDVRASEDGEDERLQDRYEDLEADQDHRQRERHGGEDPCLGPVLQEEHGPEEEDRQQEVPGQEVRGETNRQGDGPDDDVRDELDEHQQAVTEPPRCLGDDARVLQVAEEAMFRDPDGVVRHPRHDREDQRERDPAVG